MPVRRQEVRLVYDAVPEHEQVVAGSGPVEEIHETVLYAEQVLFTTQLVPVERVRMVKRVHTTEQVLSEERRVEQIDVASDHLHIGRDV